MGKKRRPTVKVPKSPEKTPIDAQAKSRIPPGEPNPVSLVLVRQALFQRVRGLMRDFPNAAFSPEAIDVMKRAMESAVSHLPEPITSAHVNSIAESILRTAKEGERDPVTLERMALLELAITSRE